MLILLLNYRDKSFDAFRIRYIKLLNMYASAWVFGNNLITSFVGKLNVSTCHDDVPVGRFGKIVDDAIPDSLVRSGYNNVSDLVH